MLRDEQKAQAAKLKNEPLHKRIGYFLYYNKLAIAAVLIAIALLFWIVRSIASFSTNNLYVMITDQQGDGLNTDFLTSTWMDQCKADAYEALPVLYIDDLELADTTLNNITVEDLQKVLALFNAKTMDVLIAPEAVFQNYGNEGMFQSLSDLLTKEEFDTLSDQNRLLYAAVKETGQSIPVGLRISDVPLTGASGLCIDEACIGLPIKQEHQEDALRYLKLFLQD